MRQAQRTAQGIRGTSINSTGQQAPGRLIPSRIEEYGPTMTMTMTRAHTTEGPLLVSDTNSPVVRLCSFTNGTADVSDPNQICRVLHQHGRDANVGRIGLDHLHATLTTVMIQDRSSMVLESDYIPVIIDLVRHHGEQSDIVSKALVVLQLLETNHKKRMIQDECIEVLAFHLSKYPKQTDSHEPICKLLALLIQDATLVEERTIVMLVKSLLKIVQGWAANTREAALQILQQVAATNVGSEKFKNVFLAILLATAMNFETEQGLREAVMSLISNMLESSVDHAPMPWPCIKQSLVPMIQQWSLWNTPALATVALQIVAHAFSNAGAAPNETAEWLSCVEVALSSMRFFPTADSVQVAAMQTTAIVLDDGRATGPLVASLHSGSAVALVQKAMANFPGSSDIVVSGWDILLALHATGDTSIPSIPVIRAFRDQVLQDSGLDLSTKTKIADRFVKICEGVIDQRTINNFGILIDLDKAVRSAQDPGFKLLVFRLFLAFLSIAQKMNAQSPPTSKRPTKVYGTTIVHRMLAQLPDEIQHAKETLQLVSELYLRFPLQSLNQNLAFDVGRAVIVVKIYTPAEFKVLCQLLHAMPPLKEACCLLVSNMAVICAFGRFECALTMPRFGI